jgi:hypothetical protein
MLRRILPILFVLLGVAGFMALKATRPKPATAAPQERVWRVETLAVTPADHRPLLALFGRVEAPDQAVHVGHDLAARAHHRRHARRGPKRGAQHRVADLLVSGL